MGSVMPPVKSRSSRNERLSRAAFLSIILDKIRNTLYMFLLTESIPARRLPAPGEERPRLFENLGSTTTRGASRKAGEDFLI